MESNIELLEKELNEEKKKWYKEKKFLIIITIIIIIIIILSIILIFTLIKGKLKITFNYTIIKSDKGFQNILVNWTSNETSDIIINVKGVQDEIIRTYKILNSTQGEILVKVYYGLPKLNIKAENKKNKYKTDKEFTIPTDEIVIAAFHATLPVLIFSLDIFNITKIWNCPIYISLQRYKAWDWENIPKGILIFDILDENNFNIEFESLLDKLKIWMGQMYKANSKVKFNLFITDVHNYIIPLCIFSNNIPSENYKIFLLSDGTGSYSLFNEIFDNNETYVKNYNEMRDKYKEFKDYIWNKKSYDRYSSKSKNINRYELMKYSYTIIKEEKNTFWWLTKIKGAFAPNNPEILEEILNNPKINIKDLNFLFKSLNENEKEQIKNLFNFNSNYFEEAYKQNKSIMIIVGTSNNIESNLYDYCLTTELFYKNDFIYYYKAHPATPIENDPEKIKNLKNIG